MEDAVQHGPAEGVVKHGLARIEDGRSALSRPRHAIALHVPLFLRRMPTGKKRLPAPRRCGCRHKQ